MSPRSRLALGRLTMESRPTLGGGGNNLRNRGKSNAKVNFGFDSQAEGSGMKNETEMVIRNRGNSGSPSETVIRNRGNSTTPSAVVIHKRVSSTSPKSRASKSKRASAKISKKAKRSGKHLDLNHFYTGLLKFGIYLSITVALFCIGVGSIAIVQSKAKAYYNLMRVDDTLEHLDVDHAVIAHLR